MPDTTLESFDDSEHVSWTHERNWGYVGDRPSVTQYGDPFARFSRCDIARMGYLARVSGRTFECYRSDLNLFFRWCHGNGLDPLEATRVHIELYLRWMESDEAVPATKTKCSRAYSPNSIGRRFSVVAGFYKFATLDDFIVKDPTVAVRKPKQSGWVKRGDYLTRTELADVITAASRTVERWPSEYALICLLGLSALRIGEALQLDVETLRYEQGYTIITGIGKGGVPFHEPLNVMTAHAVSLAVNGRAAGPLLLGKWRTRMSKSGARDLIDRLVIKELKITRKRITPHSFRRGAITAALEAGVPLRDVQIYARHADPGTTSGYDRGGKTYARNATHAVASFIDAPVTV